MRPRPLIRASCTSLNCPPPLADHNGNTPLIEAVKNGQTEVVRLLLDKGESLQPPSVPLSTSGDSSSAALSRPGADPTNASSQGLPEQYSSDPVIVELLTSARNKMASQSAPADHTYPQDSNIDVSKPYYPPPPGPYYYPGMPMPPPMLPDGTVPFYPPPPHAAMGDMSGGIGNLPPPEIARMIPCRYYPACRYGTSCMFAHPPPPQGPYIPGPIPPPAQYPAPYDGAPAPYPPTYYPVPSPSFQTPPTGPPVNPISPTLSPTVPPNGPPHPPMAPARTGEMVSPVQPTFAGGVPPPVPYGVSGPSPYGPGGPMPLPVPPHPATVPQSPQVMYPPTSPIVPTAAPYAMPPAYMGQPYPPPPVMPNGAQGDALVSPKVPLVNPQPDYYASGHRESFSHHKRGNGRRPSFGMNRKPPCLFFPSGRCKNGFVRLEFSRDIDI